MLDASSRQAQALGPPADSKERSRTVVKHCGTALEALEPNPDRYQSEQEQAMHQLTRPEPSHAIAELEKWHGRPVADFADYDPTRSYLHMITKDSPSMDEAILEGRAISGLCGKTWVPKATSYLTPGGGPVRSICPVCAAIWNARGGAR